jgi:environmental stress-induced protein Ves
MGTGKGHFKLIKIISPDQYKKILWKNGKGETTELAISEGGSIDDFDWRISIASVMENGEFSDFTGYMRNLVLLEGDGIDLHHDGSKIDHLENVLSVATFNGSCKTVGVLKSGPITDFNLMTDQKSYLATVKTYPKFQQVALESFDRCFIYGLTAGLELSSTAQLIKQPLPAGYLMHIFEQNTTDLAITGENMIVIYLIHRQSQLIK